MKGLLVTVLIVVVLLSVVPHNEAIFTKTGKRNLAKVTK